MTVRMVIMQTKDFHLCHIGGECAVNMTALKIAGTEFESTPMKQRECVSLLSTRRTRLGLQTCVKPPFR